MLKTGSYFRIKFRIILVTVKGIANSVYYGQKIIGDKLSTVFTEKSFRGLFGWSPIFTRATSLKYHLNPVRGPCLLHGDLLSEVDTDVKTFFKIYPIWI